MNVNRMMLVMTVAVMAAVAAEGAEKKQSAGSLCGKNPHMAYANRNMNMSIEIERCSLYAAYQIETKDFHDSHRMMGGGSYSAAMLHHALNDFDGKWNGIVTNWFYSTARSDLERKSMIEYGVSVEDLKYSRAELNQVMSAWRLVSSGSGNFEQHDVRFRNGVSFFTNTEYACRMKLRLRKEWIWVHDGNVFLFATSDVEGNDGYGGSDALYESWFLRFKGGTLTGSCHFRHGGSAFSTLRYHFNADNDRIIVTSTKTGDIVGEIRLGLWEYTDSNGVKKPGKIEYSGSQEMF